MMWARRRFSSSIAAAMLAGFVDVRKLLPAVEVGPGWSEVVFEVDFVLEGEALEHAVERLAADIDAKILARFLAGENGSVGRTYFSIGGSEIDVEELRVEVEQPPALPRTDAREG